MNLKRTSAIWDRSNRNDINYNWDILESFIQEFDGERLLEVSYNLFNKENVGDGSVNTSTGEINNDGFKNSGFIILKPNTTYITNAKGSGAIYDINHNRTRGLNSGTTSFTTNSNEHYIRVTLGVSQIETFMIHEGTELLPYKPYGVIPSPLIIAPELQEKIDEAMVTFEGIDGLTINRGKDFPLKSVQLGSQAPVEISDHAKNVILDAKVSGAKPDMYYRLTFVSNGHEQGGKPRYGISLGEYRKSNGWRERWVFTYNDANTPENQQNYNIEKGSDGIDTIIAVREDIVVSVTVDRAAITASTNPTFLNLITGIGSSLSAVIDPSTYSAF